MTTDTIDVTELKETDPEKLKAAIWQAVKDTQAWVVTTLPDKLIMTKAQFLLLDDQDEMRQFWTNTKERLWVTPDNAMDIIVKDD